MQALDVTTPVSVRNALRILWLGLAIDTILAFYFYSPTGSAIADILSVLLQPFIFILFAFFIYKIGRRKNWARIVYTIFILFSVPVLLLSWGDYKPLEGFLVAASLVVQACAVPLLFSNESNPWFSSSPISLKELLFSFRGRINRGTFWAWTICTFIIYCAASIATYGVFMESNFVSDVGLEGATNMADAASGVVILIISLVLLWPTLAIFAKRWHDINYSAWWTLINLVPFVGWLISLIYLGFIAGSSSTNRFGEPQV